MATHVIKIKAAHRNNSDPAASRLSLSDHGTTKVNPNDTVVWLNENANIDSFLILFDEGSGAVPFTLPPSLLASSHRKKWQVKIHKHALRPTTYKYTICWTQQGLVYAYDPKIQVNG